MLRIRRSQTKLVLLMQYLTPKFLSIWFQIYLTGFDPRLSCLFTSVAQCVNTYTVCTRPCHILRCVRYVVYLLGHSPSSAKQLQCCDWELLYVNSLLSQIRRSQNLLNILRLFHNAYGFMHTCNSIKLLVLYFFTHLSAIIFHAALLDRQHNPNISRACINIYNQMINQVKAKLMYASLSKNKLLIN